MLTYSSWKPTAYNKRIRYVETTSPTTYLAGYGQLGNVFISYITSAADVLDFETIFKTGSTLVETESDLNELSNSDAQIGKIDGRHKRSFEFSTSVIYIGYADIGVLESAAGWTIRKMVLDSNGNPTAETWTAVGTAIWNNRASEVYS